MPFHTSYNVALFPVLTVHESTSHFKKVDQGSGQGAGRRKRGTYTVVCEHFEPTRNAAMGRQTHFEMACMDL